MKNFNNNESFFEQEDKKINKLTTEFMKLCESYGFKGKVSGTANLKLYAPTIDIFKTKWIEYKYETDTLTIEGDTDGLRINLNETRPDLLKNDMLAFTERLCELFECDLHVDDIVGEDDWEKICEHTEYRYKNICSLMDLENKQKTIDTNRSDENQLTIKKPEGR